MLFNPNWKANHPAYGTLDHFIGWLETQDPKTTYRWSSWRNCLAARYGKAHGRCLSFFGFKVGDYGVATHDCEDGRTIDAAVMRVGTYEEALKLAKSYRANRKEYREYREYSGLAEAA